MVMTDFVTVSVFSKASGIYCKHESFTINDSDKCQSLFLVKLLAFTMNGNDEFVADSIQNLFLV